jgi:hypothetical protein
MASLRILVTSASSLCFKPVYAKKSLNVSTVLEILIISLWKKFSSAFVSLQRLPSYYLRKAAFDGLFSQICVIKSLKKQEIWKLVICALNTI